MDLFSDKEKNERVKNFAKAVGKGLRDDPEGTAQMLGKLIRSADRRMDQGFADELKLLRERV
jgi:hypothetical protein